MQPAPLKIRLYGDPILTKKSLPVKEIGPAERLLIESMLYTMYLQKGIGLAAPQVGTCPIPTPGPPLNPRRRPRTRSRFARPEGQ